MAELQQKTIWLSNLCCTKAIRAPKGGMPFPFTALPSLGQLIEKAEDQDCRLGELPMNGPRGNVITRYLTKRGVIAILPDVEDDERLAPAVITQLVRVLGLTGFDHCIISDDEPLGPDTDYAGPVP